MRRLRGTVAWIAGVLGALALFPAMSPARAQGSLVIYCGVNEEWCRAAATCRRWKHPPQSRRR